MNDRNHFRKEEKFKEDPPLVSLIIKESQEKCLVMAEETMREVREKMGA